MSETSVYPNPVVTFVIEYQGSFLLLHRHKNEKNYPDLWAFPGGKIERGETAIDAILREAKEETGLDLDGTIAFIDTYAFGTSVGFGFLVRAASNQVTVSEDFQSFAWISSLQDMEKYPCIPGIYNHLAYALDAIEHERFVKMDQVNLLPARYLNT